MLFMKPAVMRQIAYAHSVRALIREIVKVFIPGNWVNQVISDRDDAFDVKLGAAFATVDEHSATKDDYCRKVVDVLRDEVARLSDVLREICNGYGYGAYAESYISREKFVQLVLSMDTGKLERLKAVLANRGNSHIDMLREIGAVLEEKTIDEFAALGAVERRRENAEIKDVARDVRETISRISAVDAKISEISETVSRLAPGRRKRRGKHDVAGPVCLAIWTGDKDNTTLRGTLNTRVTYAAVIARHRTELASVGVTSIAQFRRAIHAMQTRIHAANKKSILAAQDAASLRCRAALGADPDAHLRAENAPLRAPDAHMRAENAPLRENDAHVRVEKIPTKRDGNGIISRVKNATRNAVVLTLSIVGAMAAPLRSDASPDILRGGVDALSKAA